MIYSEIRPYKRLSIFFLITFLLTILVVKVSSFFPLVEKILKYTSMGIFALIVSAIVLLIMLAYIYEVSKFIKWLFIEPYQDYKKRLG